MLRQAAEEKKDRSPGRFLDLIVFWIGLKAYRQLRGDDEHVKRATILLRRFQDDMLGGLESYLVPLLEDPVFVRFTALMRLALRPTPGLEQASIQAELLQSVLEILRARQTVLRSIFSDARSATAAMKIANLVEGDSPETLLNGLATVPPASGLQLTRGWVKEAAARAGVAPTATESVLTEAETARSLGEDLREVEVRLGGLDPLSAEAAELQEEKQDILEQIEWVASSSDHPTVVMSTAVVAASQDRSYATKIGRERKLSADQERAMMVRGKSMIAAGAGAGKTATLASKVVWHMNDLGVPPQSIIATSFSRKSAAELRERIERFGGVFPKGTDTGLGTTHSIATKLLKEYGKGTRDFLKGYQTTHLIKLAMKQVEMPGAASKPPAPQSIFDVPLSTDPVPEPEKPAATQALSLQEATNELRLRLDRLGGFLRQFAGSLFNPNDQWYGLTMKRTRDLTYWLGFSDKQRDIMVRVFKAANIPYDPDNDPLLNPTGKRAAKKERDKDKGLREKYPGLYATPLRQWFNLGLHLTDDGTEEGKPLPPGNFMRAITKFKGRCISPSEAWHMALKLDEEDPYTAGPSHLRTKMKGVGLPEAAVYAAYEFIKSADGPVDDFRDKIDFDDVLLDVSKMLLSNPGVRKQVQSRFRVVLVDEAQDQNRCQHMMFGLIAGYVDPAKAANVGSAVKFEEVAKPDGGITADTYCMIGDDKQCLGKSSMISTPSGQVPLYELSEGATVLSYRNGDIVPQKLRRLVQSQWDWGFKVRVASGRTLTMSPTHKLWASDRNANGRVRVCLTYRPDRGYLLHTPKRGVPEAGLFWVIGQFNNRKEALQEERALSLRFGIPSLCHIRKLTPDQTQKLMEEFGQNGTRLLTDRNLKFSLPHGNNIDAVQLLAHTSQGTRVTGPGVHRYFVNYREGLAFAERLSEQVGGFLVQQMMTPDGPLQYLTASSLHVGMQLLVHETEGFELQAITSIEQVAEEFLDVDVEDASNLFASDILVSNSIYEFRSADPETFIDMSDMVEGGAGFKTEILKTNYRSGEDIVSAANRLIAHNSRQVPMVCEANPQRTDRGAVSIVPLDPVEPRHMEVPAAWVADRIQEAMELKEVEQGYDSFGVGLRSNAEAYAYGLELLKRGIPFRAKLNFFNDRNTQAVLHWMTLADEGEDGDLDRINEAVLGARNAPVTMLGKKFEDVLKEQATGNYLKWLKSNWQSIYGARSTYTDNVKVYMDNLLTIAKLKKDSLSNKEVFEKILGLQGFDGASVKDALMDKVREDDEALAEIIAAHPEGKVTEDAIADVALAPLDPLNNLLAARSDLTEAMKYIRTLQGANRKFSKGDDPDDEDFRHPAVTLGTMHSWKGLEVDTMFVPVVGGAFPRQSADEDDLASERRLGYVAVTRGQNRVFVLDIPTIHVDPKTKIPRIIRSQFIDELCVPMDDPTQKANRTASSDWPEDISPQDPQVIEAFLRGEDPFEVAEQMSKTALKRNLEKHGSSVVAALRRK